MAQNQPKILYRSRDNKLIAGVCGGIAEYFGVDPTIVRLIGVLLLLAEGIGVLLYIVAWIIIPENPSQKESAKTIAENAISKLNKDNKSKKGKVTKKSLNVKASKTVKGKDKKPRGSNNIFWGSLLIIFGLYFILKRFVPWLNFNLLWPVALMAYGFYVLFKDRD